MYSYEAKLLELSIPVYATKLNASNLNYNDLIVIFTRVYFNFIFVHIFN